MKSGKKSSGNFVVGLFVRLFSSSSSPSFLIENLGVGRSGGGGGVERKKKEKEKNINE